MPVRYLRRNKPEFSIDLGDATANTNDAEKSKQATPSHTIKDQNFNAWNKQISGNYYV